MFIKKSLLLSIVFLLVLTAGCRKKETKPEEVKPPEKVEKPIIVEPPKPVLVTGERVFCESCGKIISQAIPKVD